MATITGVTPADVLAITGATVTDDQVSQALSVIEIITGLNLSDFMAFGAADRSYLQKAIAYQAAWMLAQPDYFTRTDFQSLSQDGLSVTTRDSYATVLAPMTVQALKRMSWRKHRTISVRPSRETRYAYQLATGVFEEDGWC